MPELLDDLTIVIPVFRCAKYLPATIKSALQCGNAAILIAEDASQDETLEIARKWRDSYPDRISLIENPTNLGMVANWQNAFQHVKTPFCLKLDGDDLILPSYVRTALIWLRQNSDVGILAGKPKVIGPQDYLDIDEKSLQDISPTSTPTKITGVDACRFVLRWDPYPCSASTFYRMDKWHQVGGFDLQVNWINDQEIWFRIARISAIGWYNSEAALYRVHPENVTAQFTREDKRCYNLDDMYTKAADVWPETELKSYFSWKLFGISKSYFASVLRSLKRNPREISYRSYRGIKCTIKALKLMQN